MKHIDPTQLVILLGELTALANDLRAQTGDGLIAIGTLAIDATAEKFKTTTTAVVRISGVQYSKLAATAIALTAAHPVTASKFGAILVQVNALGTVSTKISGATQTTTQVYDTSAAAIAALPSATTGNVVLGYIVIEADSGGWTGITDDMTDGSDLTTATFVNATPLTTFFTSAFAVDIATI